MSSMRQPVVPTLAAFVSNMSLLSSACSCRVLSPQYVSLRILDVSKRFFLLLLFFFPYFNLLAKNLKLSFCIISRHGLETDFEQKKL